MRSTALLLVLAVACAGCATNKPRLDPTRVHLAYYNQTRSFKTVEGTGMNRLIMEGENMTVSLASALPPMAPPQPKPPKRALEQILKTLTTLGAYGAGMYIADGMFDAAEPTIVEPTIVTVPAQ